MRKYLSLLAAAAAAAVLLSACGGPAKPETSGSDADTSAKAAKATSAADFGGMDALVKAAKAEGTINVVALPDDWANYGAVKKAFAKKYGIKINSILPNASSKEEIDAAEKNKGTKNAPDVFDLGTTVTLASLEHFAPYKVVKFDKIPAENKEATGLWVNDYTGVMAVGYNATKFGEITSIDQLTDAKFSGQVALNGKPAEAGAAFNGFLMLNGANGGTFDDLKAGLAYFTKLHKAGTLNQQDVTGSTIDAGQHGVVFDWSYNQLSTQIRLKAKGVDWKMFVPKGGEIAAYYNQAINKDAPHPAAARLWQEFLYTPEAQNLWLAGGGRPVLFDDMKAEGTLDPEAAKSLPETQSAPKTPTLKQAEAANAFLKAEWSNAVS